MPVTTPITVKFGEDEDKALHTYVKDNLKSLKESLYILHTSELPEWRRLYQGIPAQKERNWPWPNASNVVIQTIGENCDTLKARILGTIYEIMPIWVMNLVGEWPEEEQAEEQKVVAAEFMDLMALEPGELDLYRVESLACNDIVQFGTVVVKSPWVTETEEMVIALDSTKRGKAALTGKELTKYDGPRPEKLQFEDWGATPSAPTLEKAHFKYHKYPLKKWEIEKKINDQHFILTDEEKAKLLGQPDRLGPSTAEQQKQQEQNSITVGVSTAAHVAEWDFYECWLKYYHGGKTYRIIYTIHEKSELKCSAIFNFYPDNDEPWELGRLGYTNDGLYGYGFCKMLKYYQEEITTGHNQRCDNRTLANTSVLFTGRNPVIDANMALYPMACLPVDASEAAVVQMGREYQGGVEEEQLSLQLAASRAGVDQPSVGQGGGTVNKKGSFSAMNTFSVMQAGNRRVNINITDFRYMHLKLGRRFLNQYAHFGIGERSQQFGLKEQLLLKALESVKNKKLNLPIKAANASINKEIEKQNDMLLTQVMQRHQMSIGQLMQGLTNPAIPPLMLEYALGSIQAQSQLMADLFRNFGKDELNRLLPEQAIIKQLRSQQRAGYNQQQSGQQQQGAQSGNPAQPGAAESTQEQAPSGGVPTNGGGQGADGVSPLIPRSV